MRYTTRYYFTRSLVESNWKGGWTSTFRRSCIGPFHPNHGNSRYDYEINELGGQTKKGCRGLQCWSCGGFDHLQRDCKTGHDDDDDQPDGPD